MQRSKFYYFHINLKNNKSPVFFAYEKPDNYPVKIYISTDTLKPNALNYEKKITVFLFYFIF